MKIQISFFRFLLKNGVILGIFYGLFLRFCFDRNSFLNDYFPNTFEYLAWSCLILGPILIGFCSVYFSESGSNFDYKSCLKRAIISILIFCGITLIFIIETAICIVMLLPLYLVCGILGASLTYWIMKKTRSRVLSCVLFLPFFLSTIQTPIRDVTEYIWVTSTVDIFAVPEVIWKNIMTVSDISEHEIPLNFSNTIGFPLPLSAATTQIEGRQVRHIKWHDGIEFNEWITDIQNNQFLAYDIDVDPRSALILSKLDAHVILGDRYFDVLKGAYKLELLDDNKVRLHLSTQYRISTQINFYGKFWANWVLNDLHNSILSVIRTRSEDSSSSAPIDKKNGIFSIIIAD